MPRKKVTTPTSSGSLVAATAILNFFRTAEMSVALFAAGLVADTIKERQAKGKAVVAGRAKGSTVTEAVDNATRSAVGAATTTPTGPTEVKARKKPGPAKGTRRKANGAQPASQAADSGAVETNGTGLPADEVTDANALPPQEGSLDLG